MLYGHSSLDRHSCRSPLAAMAFAAICATAALPVRADTLILVDGREVEGEISSDGNVYVVKTPAGITVRISKGEVQSIRRTASSLAEIEKRWAELEGDADGNDAEAWFELAKRAARLGLHDEAEAAYTRTVELEPDHAGARRALGQVWHEGGWVDKSEIKQDAPEPAAPATPKTPARPVARQSGSGLTFTEYFTCPKCNGTRYEFWLPCTQCTKSRRPGYLDTGQYLLPCNRCGTRGKLPGVKCRTCGGYGKVSQKQLDRLNKPRRVRKGYVLCPKCSGEGYESWLPCSQCKDSPYRGFVNLGEYMLPCNRCGTRGKLPGLKCTQCGGYGIVKEH